MRTRQDTVVDGVWKVARVLVATLALAGVPLVATAATVSFQQVDWLDNEGGYTLRDSDWGVANVMFTQSDWQMLYDDPNGTGRYGYVNVVTTVPAGGVDNWAVQNKLVYFDSISDMQGRLADAMAFDLGITPGSQPVPGLLYGMQIDDQPRGQGWTGVITPAGVQRTGWLFGGEADDEWGPPYGGNSGQAAPAKARNYAGAKPGDVPQPAARIGIKEADVAKVKEEHNGCAPAAAARSLAYLGASDPRIPAIDAQKAYDDLKTNDYMKTSLGKNGRGTMISMFIAGKRKYTKDKKLPITTDESTSIVEVIKALKKGADVEIGVYWGKNAAGKSMGGHCAFVSEITLRKDKDAKITGYEVKILDDKQGDDKAENRPHTLSFDKDGKLLHYGTGAELNSFRIERVIPEPASLILMVLGGLLLQRPRGTPQ